MHSSNEQKLERGLSLTQATAVNMIDMVGIGPFITLSLIVGLMQGNMSILAWLLGALLAFMDGFVWAELGAKYPEAGGSYVFLQKLFKGRTGKLMAFLFIWQTTIQAPLVIASGSIGFAQYFSFLVPLTVIQKKNGKRRSCIVAYGIALPWHQEHRKNICFALDHYGRHYPLADLFRNDSCEL